MRHPDADYGNIFKKKSVLIPRVFLKQPDWELEIFPIDQKKENIESCPDLVEKDRDTSLRSFMEVKDHHINAIDGRKIGHFEDIIVDDSDWQIAYII